MKCYFTFTGDIHFTEYNWKHRPDINGDAKYSLQQIQGLSKEAPIIFAGDTFDSSRPIPSLLFGLRDIFEKNKIYFIDGNHEKNPYFPWVKIALPNSINLEEDLIPLSKTFELGTSKNPKYDCKRYTESIINSPNVYGINFCDTKEVLEEKIKSIPRFANILVVHQGVEGITHHNSVEIFDGMIPDNIELIIAGHIHISKIWSIKSKSHKDIMVVSPGSIHMCSMAENPNKSLWALGEDGCIYKKKLKTRDHLKIDIKGASASQIRSLFIEETESLDKTSGGIDVPVYWIIFDKDTDSEHKNIIKSILEDYKVHLIFKDDSELLEEKIETVKDNLSYGVSDVLKEFESLENDENVRNMVKILLDQNQTFETFENIKSDYI